MLLLPAFESTPPPPASRPTQSRANRLVIWMWLARKELRQVDQEADDEEAIISVPMICWSRGGSRPPPTLAVVPATATTAPARTVTHAGSRRRTRAGAPATNRCTQPHGSVHLTHRERCRRAQYLPNPAPSLWTRDLSPGQGRWRRPLETGLLDVAEHPRTLFSVRGVPHPAHPPGPHGLLNARELTPTATRPRPTAGRHVVTQVSEHPDTRERLGGRDLVPQRPSGKVPDLDERHCRQVRGQRHVVDIRRPPPLPQTHSISLRTRGQSRGAGRGVRGAAESGSPDGLAPDAPRSDRTAATSASPRSASASVICVTGSLTTVTRSRWSQRS